MLSMLDVYNTALSHLAQGYVVNDPEENSTQARLCNTFYPVARQELLDDAHQWTFAVYLLRLNQVIEALPQVAYGLPSDMIRPFKLLSEYPFYVQGQYLITADTTPTLLYVRDVQDVAAMPAKFKTALSYRLAALIAGPLTQDMNKANQMTQMFNLARQEAIAADLQQHQISGLPDFTGSLIEAR